MSSRSILPIVNLRKPYGLRSNGAAWTSRDTPNLTQQWAQTANMTIKGFEGLWPLDLPRSLGIIGNNGEICWYQPAVRPNQVLWSAIKGPFCENLKLSNCTLVSDICKHSAKVFSWRETKESGQGDLVLNLCLRVWNILDQKLVSLGHVQDIFAWSAGDSLQCLQASLWLGCIYFSHLPLRLFS